MAGGCDCSRLSGPCDVDQSKVSSEYLRMGERFALRHSASPFFVDKTGGNLAGFLTGRRAGNEGGLGGGPGKAGEVVSPVFRRD